MNSEALAELIIQDEDYSRLERILKERDELRTEIECLNNKIHNIKVRVAEALSV